MKDDGSAKRDHYLSASKAYSHIKRYVTCYKNLLIRVIHLVDVSSFKIRRMKRDTDERILAIKNKIQ